MRYSDFALFISSRYHETSPVRNQAYVEYVEKLLNTGYFVPALANMEARTVYQLHYRQLCAQLASVLSNEGLRSEGNETYTPLTDVLGFIAESHGGSQSGGILRRDTELSQMGDRYYLEIALRQIDVIQAELGSRINTIVYGYAASCWTIFYVLVLVSAATFQAAQNQGVWSSVSSAIENIFTGVFAFIIALALAIGTAVFSGAAFTWLDRVFASK